MKLKQLVKLSLLVATVSISSLSASAYAKALKLGIISGPEYEVAEVAVEQAKKLYNLDVELISFNDFVTPNQALNDGLVDANAFQHKPYLDQQIKERGYDLVPVGNTFVFPIAAYSNKLKPVTEGTDASKGVVVHSPRGTNYFIKDGSTIAIPNDPTNLGRALLLLQHEGLITLEDNVGLLPTQFDIESNPHNYKIVELEAPMLPKSLDDGSIDLAIINNTFAGQANLTPSKNGLFVEDKDSPYVNLIVTKKGNENNPEIQELVKAYQTDAVAEKADQVFNGGAVKGW